MGRNWKDIKRTTNWLNKTMWMSDKKRNDKLLWVRSSEKKHLSLRAFPLFINNCFWVLSNEFKKKTWNECFGRLYGFNIRLFSLWMHLMILTIVTTFLVRTMVWRWVTGLCAYAVTITHWWALKKYYTYHHLVMKICYVILLLYMETVASLFWLNKARDVIGNDLL